MAIEGIFAGLDRFQRARKPNGGAAEVELGFCLANQKHLVRTEPAVR